MQEKLIIYLHANDLNQPSWAVLNAASEVRQSAYRDGVQGLAQIADEKDVIVIVPAEDVLLTHAKLPNISRSRLQQAVPFALEDELIDDVDTLHFAMGPQLADQDLPVAVVAHEKMQQWLDLLRSWGIQVNSMIPATLALPYQENHWHIAISEIAIARTGLFNGFACDINNLAELLNLALTSSTYLPQLITIDNYTQKTFSSTLDIPTKIAEHAFKEEDMINRVARFTNAPSINLLQGSYAIKKSKLPEMNKLWKLTAGLTIAWVFLLFFYPILSYFILNSRMSDIQNQIENIYRRNFPKASSVVAPKLRMEEKLQKLNDEVGENRLLLLLGYLGKGLSDPTKIKLNRLDFQNSQLTLELTAASSEDFSAFTDVLAQQGLNVKQQNANLAGARINATLLID